MWMKIKQISENLYKILPVDEKKQTENYLEWNDKILSVLLLTIHFV